MNNKFPSFELSKVIQPLSLAKITEIMNELLSNSENIPIITPLTINHENPIGILFERAELSTVYHIFDSDIKIIRCCITLYNGITPSNKHIEKIETRKRFKTLEINIVTPDGIRHIVNHTKVDVIEDMLEWMKHGDVYSFQMYTEGGVKKHCESHYDFDNQTLQNFRDRGLDVLLD